MKLVIRSDAIRKIVEKSLGSPIEAVFVGVGLSEEGLYRVVEVFECRNVSKTPGTKFVADPMCLYTAYRYAESRGMDIVMIAHSHPMPPTPSADDVKGMRLWIVPWLIVDSLSGRYRAWILLDNSLREVQIEETG